MTDEAKKIVDKVYCPWCNSEMKLEELFPFSGVYAYTCECGAVAPSVYEKEEAYAAAIRRPLQKPMTLEESYTYDDSVPCRFIEFRDMNYIKVGHVHFPITEGKKKKCRLVLFMESIPLHMSTNSYGEHWRCWATKPTQEEREAAKWNA